jgi:tRNA G10  N-methylase Trm11
VTDPPFGRREKAHSESDFLSFEDDTYSTFDQNMININNPRSIIGLLMKIAVHRLKPAVQLREENLDCGGKTTKCGARLVFWLPTDPNVKTEQVIHLLNRLIAQTTVSVMEGANISSEPYLKVVRVVQEELNDSLWRWLCVLERL